MFPLGTVLLPGGLLPLNVFEQRYRQLVRDCLASSAELGVVLIERGSEVGGGDVRRPIGTRARMVQVDSLPDGRFALVIVGLNPIRVEQWLDDEPYPKAMVEDLLDPPGPDGLQGAVEAVGARLQRVLAMASELGLAGSPADVELGPDAGVAAYRAATLAPFGAQDRYGVLAERDPSARLQLVADHLAVASDVMRFRLGGRHQASFDDPQGQLGGSDEPDRPHDPES
jgi:Lon protease-like protein